MRPSRSRRVTHSAAFTLIELLVVIAIVGVITGLLTPAIQSAREHGNRVTAINNVRAISFNVYRYAGPGVDRFPEHLGAIVSRLEEEEGLDIHEVLTDGRIVIGGYVFELIVDRERIEEHLADLEALNAEGMEAAERMRSIGIHLRFLIFARPAIAGRTGCHFIYAAGNRVFPDLPHDEIEMFAVTSPRCEEIKLEMFRRIQRRALYDTGRLLIGQPTKANDVLSLLKGPQTIPGAFMLLDTDGDSKVTFFELSEMSQRDQFAAVQTSDTATAIDGEDPVAVFREFLRYVLDDELQVGAAGEDIDDIGVTLDDLPEGDLTALVSTESFAELIDILVPHDGLANSFVAKVAVAEQLRLQLEATDDPAEQEELREACEGVVRALRNELRAQADKGLLLEDAMVLDAAVRVLCPSPIETSE